MVDTFLVCTTCELCNLRCSAALPIEPSWMKLRGELIQDEKRMTFPPFEMMGAALHDRGRHLGRLPQGPRRLVPRGPAREARPRRTGRRPSTSPAARRATSSTTSAWPACACWTRPASTSPTSASKENCCATPMLVAGKWDLFAEMMKTEHRQRQGGRGRHGHHLLPGLRHDVAPRLPRVGREARHRLRHHDAATTARSWPRRSRPASSASPSRENGAKPDKVTWHDSCHIGRVSGVYEPPRELIKAIPERRLSSRCRTTAKRRTAAAAC